MQETNVMDVPYAMYLELKHNLFIIKSTPIQEYTYAKGVSVYLLAYGLYFIMISYLT